MIIAGCTWKKKDVQCAREFGKLLMRKIDVLTRKWIHAEGKNDGCEHYEIMDS
jgi:hypothetical protein